MDKTFTVIYPDDSSAWRARDAAEETARKVDRLEAALVKAGVIEPLPKEKPRGHDVASLSEVLKKHYARALEDWFK